MVKVAISEQDISHLLTKVSWSGSVSQAARRLEFEFVQDVRDPLLPVVEYECGMTCYGGDDDGNVLFVGNIYDVEVDRAKSTVKIVSFDNLFVLNRSKTTRKFTDAYPESIARQVCEEMGVIAGEIVETAQLVSFIANGKTGYQVIMGAYDEAAKKTEKVYQCVMNGTRLNVIEKGSLCGTELESGMNITESIYKESIENLVNSVMVVDESGNALELISDEESVRKYSMYRDIYRQSKEKDTASEARALMKKPERGGSVIALGDYRMKAGYSLIIRDNNFEGQFWIKSDTHTFSDGIHETKLELEYENVR